MKSFSKKRLAAFGMAGALAMGTVASVGVLSPANAADTAYTCTTTNGALTFPVSVANPFPASGKVGEEVAAAPVTMDVSIAESQLGLIKLLLGGAGLPTTALSGSITDAAMVVGGQSVALNDLAAPSTAIPASGDMVLPVVGSTSAFTPKKGGNLAIGLPTKFTFIPAGVPAFAMPCTLSGAESTAGTMSVAKLSSTTTAKVKNAPVTTAERAKVLVKSVTSTGAASGKVVAKEGSKVLATGTLSDTGKVTLKLPKLKKGEHKVVFRYKGNGSTKASAKTLTLKIKRA